jgi:hypothetical protein
MGKGKGGGKSRSGSRGKRSPARTVLLSTLWGAVVFFTGACLILVLNIPPHTEHAGQDATGRKTADKSPSEMAIAPDGPPPALKTGGEGDREYEEQSRGLMRAVEQIDLALVQSLTTCGVKTDKLRHVTIDFRKKGRKKYHFQEVELRVDREKGRQILYELEKLLANWLPEAELEAASATRHSWRIRVRSRERPEPEENGPRIALVMDDMGNSLERARTLLRLFESNIALSVLPQARYSEEIARVASNKGADVLLHLPMEPKDYPETDPGAGALFVGMSAERIRSVIKRDLQGISGLVGVNNHMGSRFTTVKEDMRPVFSVLRRRGLFYMDSLTSPESVGEGLASRMGVETINRDIFLDNEKKVKSIRLQLNKAEHLARKVGYAVITGHPYPQTVEALRLWLAEKDKDIQLCRLSSLVQAENDSQAERREEYGTADAGDY